MSNKWHGCEHRFNENLTAVALLGFFLMYNSGVLLAVFVLGASAYLVDSYCLKRYLHNTKAFGKPWVMSKAISLMR
jgi:hypothetical protein